MTDEVIKQAAEAMQIEDAGIFPTTNLLQKDYAERLAQAAYEIFRADFVRQLESDEMVEAVSASVVLGEDGIGCDVYLSTNETKAALKAVAERIK